MDTSKELSTFETVQMVLRARLENKEIDFSLFDEHSNWEVLRGIKYLDSELTDEVAKKGSSEIIHVLTELEGVGLNEINESIQALNNEYQSYLINKGELVDIVRIEERFREKYPEFGSIYSDDAELFITYHNQSGQYFERELEVFEDYKALIKARMAYCDAYAEHEESEHLEYTYLKPIEKFMSERMLKREERLTRELYRDSAHEMAVSHVNNLVKQAGGNIWGWKKTEEAIETWTERMMDNPLQYGLKKSNQLNNRHMSTENENQKESSNELRTPSYEYFAMQSHIRKNLKNYRGKTVPEREGLIDKNLEFLKKWTDSRFQEIVLEEDPRKVKHAIKENFKDMRISNYELAFAQNYYQKVKLEMEKSGKDKSVIKEFRKDAMSAIESTRSAADYKMINSLDYAIEKAEDDKSKDAAEKKKEEVLDDKMYYAIKAGREIEIDRLASNMDAPGPKTEQLLHDDMYWENRAQNRKHIADMLSDRMNNFETDEQLDKAIEKGLEKEIEKDKGMSM